MSERAIVWAQGQKAKTSTQKFCLMRLAAYVDYHGHGWAYVERLAEEMQTTERTVYRCLRALETQKLIKRTGKFKGRNVPFYQLSIEVPAEAQTLTPVSGLNPDMGVRVQNPTPDMGDRVTPDTGVTPKQGNQPSVEDKSSPSGRARAGEAEGSEDDQADGFAAFWAAMPEASKRGVSSERIARPAYAEEVADGAAPAELLEAARTYAADKSLWGASGKPKAAHNFLKSGVWKGLKGSPGTALGAAAWAGPPEVRAAFVAALGEARVRTALDPAGWDGETATIVPRTTWAREALAAAVPQGVQLGQPKRVA